jgi:hypothetical protein
MAMDGHGCFAYADPEAALRNFGPGFNAGVPGEVLLQMVAGDADCEGILVNSATQEISLPRRRIIGTSAHHRMRGARVQASPTERVAPQRIIVKPSNRSTTPPQNSPPR